MPSRAVWLLLRVFFVVIHWEYLSEKSEVSMIMTGDFLYRQVGKEGYYGKSTDTAGNYFSSGSSGLCAEAYRADRAAGTKNLNDLVIYVILPCNILHAFMNSPVEGRLFIIWKCF